MSERASVPPASPLRYDPSVEVPEKEEGHTDAALTETMLSTSETTFKDGGHGLRSVHAKSHGLLHGELRFLDDLPRVLAQGVAGTSGTYPVVIRLRQSGGEWELRVQLCTDLEAMPVEDATVAWPEDKSPYVAVARISVPPQEAWSEARSAAVDDGLAFTPWHGLAAHRPIGSIMRARRNAYARSAQFRAEKNGRVIKESRTASDLPG